MRISIIDCYTDEPSGLGVMPYVGTYPRYIFGALKKNSVDAYYVTIDDLRSLTRNADLEADVKTNIGLRNVTRDRHILRDILNKSQVLIVIAGMHTPGKYLSANPGTTVEVMRLLKEEGLDKKFKILTGPASMIGSGKFGGRAARKTEAETDFFEMVAPEVEYSIRELLENNFTELPVVEDKYDILREIAPLGAGIVEQLPHDPRFHIAEIETMSGCAKDEPCSFCIEKVKCPLVAKRSPEDIVEEVKALSSAGLKNFRVGKQTCIYSYGSADVLKALFKALRPFSNILHIDNANPLFVDREKTKVLTKYCTPGNVASFGVESFDEKVIVRNDLHITPEMVYEKASLINELGSARGENGMPRFLPGINLLFGLEGESKSTHQENLCWLGRMLEDGLLLRRINIREVVLFPKTKMGDKIGNKFIKKNRKYYWKWRNEIRKSIDYPMLQNLVPKGTVLKGLRTEIYDGNTTFARQVGTYPLVMGIPGRIGLDRILDAKVVDHMLRSVVGKEVGQSIL